MALLDPARPGLPVPVCLFPIPARRSTTSCLVLGVSIAIGSVNREKEFYPTFFGPGFWSLGHRSRGNARPALPKYSWNKDAKSKNGVEHSRL